jgi:hypothetical protein
MDPPVKAAGDKRMNPRVKLAGDRKRTTFEPAGDKKKGT